MLLNNSKECDPPDICPPTFSLKFDQKSKARSSPTFELNLSPRYMSPCLETNRSYGVENTLISPRLKKENLSFRINWLVKVFMVMYLWRMML